MILPILVEVVVCAHDNVIIGCSFVHLVSCKTQRASHCLIPDRTETLRDVWDLAVLECQYRLSRSGTTSNRTCEVVTARIAVFQHLIVTGCGLFSNWFSRMRL